MNGRVLCHPPIAVDFWKLRDCSHVRLFFLSHMHSDHTEGLTPSWSQPIYCSPVTRLLLLDQFKLNPEKVHGLALNESHCLQLIEETNESLSVTLFDANHCPGAVMFLFEGYFGRILYTGDFRYSQSLNSDESFARVRSAAVDKLYLDNTFCSPQCRFPSREKAMSEILGIIADNPDCRVMIGLRKLGKEELLVEIAKHVRMKIFVTKERLHWLELLEVPNVFTTDETETRIWVVDWGEINHRNVRLWNEEVPTIVIIPTALYRALDGNSGPSFGDAFVVPYSDHSSYSELCEFVSLVGPREVIPILTDAKDRLGKCIPERRDMSCFAEYLDTSPSLAFCPPVDFAVVRRKEGRDCARSTSGSVPGRKIKKLKYNHVVHPKGVNYEYASGDDQGKNVSASLAVRDVIAGNMAALGDQQDWNSAPLAVDRVTAENLSDGTNEQDVVKSEVLETVEENILMERTSVDSSNAKRRQICLPESVDICELKSPDMQLEHEETCHKLKACENADDSSLCEVNLLSILSDECDDNRKCDERNCKELVEKEPREYAECKDDQKREEQNCVEMVEMESTEYTDCFNIRKDCCGMILPLVVSPECENGQEWKEVESKKEAKDDVNSLFQPHSEKPSVASADRDKRKHTDDCSRGEIMMVKVDNGFEAGMEPTGSSTDDKCAPNCAQSSFLVDVNNDNVLSSSIVDDIIVSHLPSERFYFDYLYEEDDVPPTQCTENDGNVLPDVIPERLKLWDSILQRLKPTFEAEAQRMFERFMRSRDEN